MKLLPSALRILCVGCLGGGVLLFKSRNFSSVSKQPLKPTNVVIHAMILGPPGSGKGTISERVVKEFGLVHLSSGDLLRRHIMDKTEFGVKIQHVVESGGLVGTELLAPLIEHELSQVGKLDSPKGWLLDGYPRTEDQAARLASTFPPNVVIYLNVPFKTIIDRIKNRWVHLPSGRVYNLDFNPPNTPGKDNITGEDLIQREDDKPESVQKRLEQYQESTNPLISFYRKQGVLIEFRGTETNKIYPEVSKTLNMLASEVGSVAELLSKTEK